MFSRHLDVKHQRRRVTWMCDTRDTTVVWMCNTSDATVVWMCDTSDVSLTGCILISSLENIRGTFEYSIL